MKELNVKSEGDMITFEIIKDIEKDVILLSILDGNSGFATDYVIRTPEQLNRIIDWLNDAKEKL